MRNDHISDLNDDAININVDTLIQSYNMILYRYIDANSAIADIIQYTALDIQSSMQKVVKLYNGIQITNPNLIADILCKILTFIQQFRDDDDNIKLTILEQLDMFVKKMKKFPGFYFVTNSITS